MIWNGGVLSCNGQADSWGGMFPKNDYIKVYVTGGGAIYETAAGRESKSETIAQPLSGSGSFTKRGGGTLNLTGALDLKGGFKVEGGTLNIGGGALARTTFMELSVAKDSVLNLNGAAVRVASYTLDGVAQPEGTYNAHGGTVTVGNDENPAGWLVVDGEIDLQDGILSVESVSGSGFATNGIVAVNGDVVVSVGRTWAVDVPTFDMLALGPKARLVVKGAGTLPRDKTINILPFTTLSGRFASVVGVGGAVVNLTYEDDHVCAQCEPGGTRIMLR
jgi:autotransporter-associated beta strand protein